MSNEKSLNDEIAAAIFNELLNSKVKDNMPEAVLDHFLHQYVKFSLKKTWLPLDSFQKWLENECYLRPEEVSTLILEQIKPLETELGITIVMPGDEIPAEAFIDEEDEREQIDLEDDEEMEELDEVPDVDLSKVEAKRLSIDKQAEMDPDNYVFKGRALDQKASEPIDKVETEEAGVEWKPLGTVASPKVESPSPAKTVSPTSKEKDASAPEPAEKPAEKPKEKVDPVKAQVRRLEQALSSYFSGPGQMDDQLKGFIEKHLKPFEPLEELAFKGDLGEIEDDKEKLWARYSWRVIRSSLATILLLEIDFENYNTLKGSGVVALSKSLKTTSEHLEHAQHEIYSLNSVISDATKNLKLNEANSLNKTLEKFDKSLNHLKSLHSSLSYVPSKREPTVYKKSEPAKEEALKKKASTKKKKKGSESSMESRPLFVLIGLAVLFLAVVYYFASMYFMMPRDRYDSKRYDIIVPITDAVRLGNAFKAVVSDDWLELSYEERKESAQELMDKVRAQEENIVGIMLMDSKGNVVVWSSGNEVLLGY